MLKKLKLDPSLRPYVKIKIKIMQLEKWKSCLALVEECFVCLFLVYETQKHSSKSKNDKWDYSKLHSKGSSEQSEEMTVEWENLQTTHLIRGQYPRYTRNSIARKQTDFKSEQNTWLDISPRTVYKRPSRWSCPMSLIIRGNDNESHHETHVTPLEWSLPKWSEMLVRMWRKGHCAHGWYN